MAYSKDFCFICNQQIDPHDAWEETEDGAAHDECLDLEEDLDQ